MEEVLQDYGKNQCALCQSKTDLTVYEVPPATKKYTDSEVIVCTRCLVQIEGGEPLDPSYWRFLSTVMWSEVPAIQVMAWRMLNRLKEEAWAADNLEMLYLDDYTLEWAKAVGEPEFGETILVHKDSNGQILQNGDSVVLTRSLDVRGSSLNAKMGTVVKNIRLVADNAEQIEGKIEGQTIVILTKYLRKQ